MEQQLSEFLSEHSPQLAFLILPTLVLIIPFIIVFFCFRTRHPVFNSVTLFSLCVLLEGLWWVMLFVLDDRYPKTSGILGQLFLIPNILVVLAVVLHVEMIKTKSPFWAVVILAAFCGFFHGFGIWLLFCEAEGGINADNVGWAIFFSSFVGIFSAIAYALCSCIIAAPFWILRLIRQSSIDSP